MESRKEEIAADLVWRYVEQIREADPNENLAFNRAELEQLVDVLAAAGAVPAALESAAPETPREAVRRRLERVLTGPAAPGNPERAEPAVPRPEPSQRGMAPGLFRNPVAYWRYALAIGALCVQTMVLVSVNLWHKPQPNVKVKVVRMPEVPGIEPMDEKQAHAMMPRMVQNQLSDQEEKDLMWHMLVCRGCFNEYREMKHSGHTVQQDRKEFETLVRR